MREGAFTGKTDEIPIETGFDTLYDQHSNKLKFYLNIQYGGILDKTYVMSSTGTFLGSGEWYVESRTD